MRKVTEISLAWQQKAFKAASRLRSAERGVGDVLKPGVGTRSGAPGSPSGCTGRIWEGNAGGQHRAAPVPLPSSLFRCCARCRALSWGGSVLKVRRGCENAGSRGTSFSYAVNGGNHLTKP